MPTLSTHVGDAKEGIRVDAFTGPVTKLDSKWESAFSVPDSRWDNVYYKDTNP